MPFVNDKGEPIETLTRDVPADAKGRAVLRAGCCGTVVRWPGPDEAGGCRCGRMGWRQYPAHPASADGDAAPTTLGIVAEPGAGPVAVWEES